MRYLRYAEDIEQPDADEQATIDGIIQGMTQQTETVEQREGMPSAPATPRARPA